ncbi:unnamed protein product [Cyclocybe aegerita]|uniref:Uncharacterized protein n=1 Tax=Cyclocybe aegerita TaxID=1973307 RepID=A0A8S0VUW5_CYCAE|nr:unnamed protein product [Cyclocybe aegerita]
MSSSLTPTPTPTVKDGGSTGSDRHSVAENFPLSLLADSLSKSRLPPPPNMYTIKLFRSRRLTYRRYTPRTSLGFAKSPDNRSTTVIIDVVDHIPSVISSQTQSFRNKDQGAWGYLNDLQAFLL